MRSAISSFGRFIRLNSYRLNKTVSKASFADSKGLELNDVYVFFPSPTQGNNVMKSLYSRLAAFASITAMAASPAFAQDAATQTDEPELVQNTIVVTVQKT